MIDEKELQNVSGEKVEDMTPDYLAAINELKQNSVDRSKYEQLRAENKKLLDSIVNGQAVDVPVQQAKRSSDEIRQELFTRAEDLNNIEGFKLALELREALISEGKPDPFLPIGAQISPTNEDIELAARAAQVYQEVLDYAEGDNEVFTNELQRRTKDVRIPRK